jgi:hypothetical protein
MRFKCTWLALFCCIFQSCYQVERNCQDFKTGTFSFTYLLNGEEQVSTFTRTSEYNIDFIEGKADSSSIRWINDCEFVLKKLNPKNKAEEKAIHMKILSTTDSSYTFEYQLAVKESNKAQRVEKGVATRVRQ